jgi:L-ribulose-5-phosphate 3-epimerase
MNPKLRIAAITDEFSTTDFAAALDAMVSIGMTGAELRVLWGKNIMDLSRDELNLAKELLAARNMEAISIASPLLKCVLPDAPPVDSRFQQDSFNAKYTIEDQARLADKAFELAGFFGAKIVRVFSYWRSIEPHRCFDGVVTALNELSVKAKHHDLIVGLENEHACNVATGEEAAAMLAAVEQDNVKLVWDPANAKCAGEDPFPFGYSALPKDRIVHVHVKDCHMEGHQPIWGPVGTRSVNWKGQLAALYNDGYRGWLSLETHWPGPQNDKYQASVICGWNLRGLAAM